MSTSVHGPDAGALPAAQSIEPGPHAVPPCAWRHAPSCARFLGVAACGLTLDLWSKHWAFHTLRQGGRWVIIPHALEFQTMLNPGALFGIGGGQTTLFLLASAFALLLVGWMFVQSSPRRRLLHVALGGVLAGALGNMYDRAYVRLLEQPVRSARGAVWVQAAGQNEKGYVFEEYPPGEQGLRLVRKEPGREVGFVRDFIKIPTKLFGERDLWPWVFNVADMLLVGGVSILALFLWFDRRGGHAPGAIRTPPAGEAPGSPDRAS